MSHAQRPRQMTVARSTNLMANQKNKGKRTQKRTQARGAGGRLLTSSNVNVMAPQSNRTVLTRTVAPKFSMSGDSLIVKNKELWVTLSTVGNADVLGRVGLNPADGNVFPWLSAIADRYTYYRWRHLRVCFQTYVGANTTGDAHLGLFYDREDLDAWFSGANPLGGITQTVGSSGGPVWSSTISNDGTNLFSQIMSIADVRRAHMRTNYHLIDSSTASTALDNQAVAVFLATLMGSNGSGSASSTPVGRIWFDYEIELLHPTAQSANSSLAVVQSGFDPNRDFRTNPVSPSFPGPAPVPKPLDSSPDSW